MKKAGEREKAYIYEGRKMKPMRKANLFVPTGSTFYIQRNPAHMYNEGGKRKEIPCRLKG